ncbi:MAG: ion transporter [Alphaproteobacteria bacterium]|nr:ion transporter [Alphaproteobacteria bacterium]MCB9930652.1 ion transporter [Alphaproteobacteria bacterium]
MQDFLFQQLFPEGRRQPGLSLTNWVVSILIGVSVVITVAESEPTLPEMMRLWCNRISNAVSVVFLVEYVLRVYAAGCLPEYRGIRGRLRFVTRLRMLIDLVAVSPVFAPLPDQTVLMRIARLARILRLLKLGNLAAAEAAIVTAVSARRFELGLAGVLAAIILLVSATLMYLVEGPGQPEQFGSIPRALWWSVATLTTVGYGDVVPHTWLGKVIAGASAIIAVSLVALPAGILAAAFSDAFQEQRAQRQAERIAARQERRH